VCRSSNEVLFVTISCSESFTVSNITKTLHSAVAVRRSAALHKTKPKFVHLGRQTQIHFSFSFVTQLDGSCPIHFRFQNFHFTVIICTELFLQSRCSQMHLSLSLTLSLSVAISISLSISNCLNLEPKLNTCGP